MVVLTVSQDRLSILLKSSLRKRLRILGWHLSMSDMGFTCHARSSRIYLPTESNPVYTPAVPHESGRHIPLFFFLTKLYIPLFPVFCLLISLLAARTFTSTSGRRSRRRTIFTKAFKRYYPSRHTTHTLSKNNSIRGLSPHGRPYRPVC